jgi:hypothetical protein
MTNQKNIQPLKRFSLAKSGIFATGATVLGIAVILVTLAAGAAALFEPEKGTLTGGAKVVTVAGASGGKAVQFNPNPTPPPTPTPTPTPPPAPSGPYLSDAFKAWSAGPNPTGDPAFYPIGVWLQNPDRTEGGTYNAANYKNIGINLDVGISSWPGCAWCAGEESVLESTDWRAWLDPASPSWQGINRIKADTALARVVTAWQLGDEIDMAHWDPNNTDAYPTNFKNYAANVKTQDATRPRHMNFGKGMAIRNWGGYQYWQPGGAGSYDGDMALYCQNIDLVSADYYGYTDPYEPANYHGAWTYGKVIDNIHYYCGASKLAMGFVETSHPYSVPDTDPNSWITPDQVEAAVWNIVVHGGNGFIYFVHHFTDTGLAAEDALMLDPTMKARVSSINAAVKSLAPVLNSISQSGVSVTSTNSIPVTFMYKQYAGAKYIIAQSDGDSTHTSSGTTTATFTISGVSSGTATVVGEGRTVSISAGKIIDSFGPYAHHVYQF